EFRLPVGYSDHTQGIEVSLAAAALGACVLEKHFTLDRKMEGPDHKASLEPDELKALVDGARKIQTSLGSALKKPNSSELKIAKIARKSIVAGRDIPKSTKITEAMLAVKRPGTGLEPKYWDNVVGKKSKKEIKKDALIRWSDLGR